MMNKLTTFDWVAVILVIIGGLNWGLLGFFNFNLVDSVFSMGISRVIYGLVGLAALYLAFTSGKLARK